MTYSPKWGPDFIVRFYVAAGIVDPNNAGVQAIVTAINACTRAVALQIELTQINVLEAAAVSGAYYGSEDKAQFNAMDVDSKAHNYKVPGILASLLDDNQETIDPEAPFVEDVVAALNTYAKGRGGADITGIGSIHRMRNRKPLKSAPAVA